MKKIILTGGGTAGHVTPNLALLPGLRAEGWEVEYIGSGQGIERNIISGTGTPFHAIQSGKLRRYMDRKNFTDPFRIVWGMVQAWSLLRRLRPRVVFSKGGFVSVPVVVAAGLCRIPVIIHESDLSPGLANRLCLPFARLACASFPATLSHLPRTKALLTGAPIRQELFSGQRDLGYRLCNLHSGYPILLAMGGSLGSRALNQALRTALPRLLDSFQVVHLCGQGGLDASREGIPGYRQFEFLGEELAHVLAMADLVVSRAGANSIFELLALRKPNLLIPLSRAASRGDQIQNAESFREMGFSRVLHEEQLSADRLCLELSLLAEEGAGFVAKMDASPLRNGVDALLEQIRKFA